ncbi:hypothetical protein CQY20_21545 [Mycolicibacterium agri]|uniref:Uncharacterized protein n=1 Tax=Mycolicibacterium agri TaxID=36811 RepID=A0A2A7MVE9_MYCAG|nr:hypothetical protein [Mycolicibacterium agri]PEG35493.1 hypothetical protein CQY20_21545 [Mycolicibacterium agri]GFG48934.1 hypothetical protein MAGR_03750 [Mycolicibacterium agri]
MTNWRTTFGGCLLSAALFVSSAGGAVAAADSDTDAPTSTDTADTQTAVGATATGQIATTQAATSQVTEAPTKPSTESSSASTGSTSETVPPTAEAASPAPTNKVDTAAPSGPMAVAATTTTTSAKAPATAAEVKNNDVSGVTAADPVQAKPQQSAAAASSQDSAPASAVSQAPPPQSAPAAAPAADVAEAVAPASKALADAAKAAQSFAAVIARLPASPTPVDDFVAALQHLLSAVSAVTATLARMPAELTAMLGVPGRGPGLTGTSGSGGVGRGLDSVAASKAAKTLTVPTLPKSPARSPQMIGGAASRGGLLASPTPGGGLFTGSSDELSVSGPVPTTPVAAGKSDGASTLKHAVGAVFVAASLLALAAIALPGSLGLLLFGAVGTRIGYRQAKAAATLQPLGVARFVRSGPLGVVRSGNMIALPARRPRVRGRQPSSHENDRMTPVA